MMHVPLRSLLFALAGAANAAGAQWAPQASGTDAELRGLSVLSPRVAWASGTHGTVLHTTDGGRHWVRDSIPGTSALDFRAIEGTSAHVAHVMSIGDSSRIYRTTDGGAHWSLRFTSTRKGSFFDCLRFWDARHGIAMSDPVEGKFLLVTTSDGGESWREVPTGRLPEALPGEGGFAASGSCIAVSGASDVWFVTGGAATARVFHSRDRGESWSVSELPLRAGIASAGAFSVAFRDRRHGVVAGGDYQQPTLAGRNLALTSDGGVTWTLADSATSPGGYRSAVSFVPSRAWTALVAVGSSGTDVSRDGGRSWMKVDSVGYNSVQVARGGGFAVGPKGRVAAWAEAKRSPRAP